MWTRAESWTGKQGGEGRDGAFRNSIVLTESVEKGVLEFGCIIESITARLEL